jgi:type II secretory pathway pseudopilin PulG
MNFNLPKRSAGFTLIELLISASIVMIIAAGIIPSFSGYIKDQNLKQAQEQLKSDLRTIQNRALTGALSDVTMGTPAVPVLYWGVVFYAPDDNSGTNTYKSFVSNSASSCPPSPKIDQGTYTFKNNIRYFDNTVCLFFSIKNGDLIRHGGIGNYIDLKYKASGNCVAESSGNKTCQRIFFNEAGLIY